jgi:hypothetical protein
MELAETAELAELGKEVLRVANEGRPLFIRAPRCLDSLVTRTQAAW